jgi:glycosyltransferase involved in cell wall biosynthesis
MHRIARTLSANGFDVLLAGRYKLGAFPAPEGEFRTARLPCFFQKGFLFYAEFNLRLFIYLLFTRFDAICAVDLDTLMACSWASRFKKKPLVYDAHEYFTELPEVIDRPAVQRSWDKIAQNHLPRITAGYAVSGSVAQALNEKYGTQLEVVHNYPVQSSAPPEQAGDSYMIYQGVINIGRGLEQLVEAMRDIDIPLVIAGKGDIEDEMVDYLERESLTGKVRMLGAVDPEDLPRLTAEAKIGFNLLADMGLNYRYSLANKFLDYIQAGIPQICTDFPEYRKINEKYEVALLVSDLEVATIKSAIKTLLEDRSLYERLAKNCLEARKELCWEQEEAKLLAIWQHVVNSNK